jgi:hypothetical protein
MPNLDDVLEQLRARIETRLRPILREQTDSGPEDQSWYWAAPILLDLHHYPQSARTWLQQRNLGQAWAGEIEEEASTVENRTQWNAHVEEARKLITGRYPLGRPPEDLVAVLAYLALGGPGVVALRALWRGADRHDTPLASREKAANLAFRTHAAQIAWSFRSLYNLPEVTALLRGLTLRDLGHDDPYWRRVLVYNTLGGLQAVLDEFVHVLRDSLGLLDELPATLTQHISTAICNALSLRTAALGVDQVAIAPDGAGMSVELHRLRTHFALRFGEEKHDDGKGENRKEQVRQAFNSPFWPFVLATTSVGQEGLDFHTYCHAIVH